MWQTVRQLTWKQQFLCFIEFIIAYFSPIIAIAIFLFMKLKKKQKLFQVVPLVGAFLAMFLFMIDYVMYLTM